MKRSRFAFLVVAPATLFALTGCTYQTLTFRPVDTTSQLVQGDVKVTLSRDGAGGVGGGPEVGTTNQHGQVRLTDLKTGDILIFTKPGYEPASVKIEVNAYNLKSPASEPTPERFFMQDADTIPVPLHRQGAVVKSPIP